MEDVRWDSGQAIPADSYKDIKPLRLKELAGIATSMGGPVAGHSEINASGQGATFCAQLVDVEIDPDTGFTSPKRHTVFQDAGRAISPDYVEGQMQGAPCRALAGL